MRALIAAIGLLALFSACGPQSSNIRSDSDTAIINGDPVSDTDDITKSVASLQGLSPSGPNHRCTATFIQKRVLLTAAHCLFDKVNQRMIPRDASRMAIALGANVQRPTRLYRISSVSLPPNFDPTGALCDREDYTDKPPALCERIDLNKRQTFDIALVFLGEDPPAYIKPVAPWMEANNQPFSAILAGYGYSQYPRKLTDEQRRQALGVLRSVKIGVDFSIRRGLQDWPTGILFTNDTFGVQLSDLWDRENRHVFTHGGDSGSPIFAVDKAKNFKIVGVLHGAGDKQIGGVKGLVQPLNYTYNTYARVKFNMTWIQSQLQPGARR